MVLRSAAAAASADTRIHRASLDRLAAAQQPMPEPWPDDARQALSDLLLAGHRAIPVIEATDEMGLWTQVLPGWRARTEARRGREGGGREGSDWGSTAYYKKKHKKN